jgi:hypothetical protein
VYETGVYILIYGHADPNSPGENIDVFLWALIDELKQL